MHVRVMLTVCHRSSREWHNMKSAVLHEIHQQFQQVHCRGTTDGVLPQKLHHAQRLPASRAHLCNPAEQSNLTLGLCDPHCCSGPCAQFCFLNLCEREISTKYIALEELLVSRIAGSVELAVNASCSIPVCIACMALRTSYGIRARPPGSSSQPSPWKPCSALFLSKREKT